MRRIIAGLLLLAGWTTCIPVGAQKHKGINLALEWKVPERDSVKCSYADIGLCGNITNLKGLNLHATAYLVHRDASGLSLSGLGGYVGHDMRGVQIGSLLNVVENDLHGVQIGLLPNVVGHNASGLQLSLLGNASGDTTRGVQISTVGNIGRVVRGLQVSAVNNIVSDTLYGVQLTGPVNIAYNVRRGMQLSVGANICAREMRGVQLSGANYAWTLRGCQIGLLNLAGERSSGIQIGIVNISSDSLMHKIGLVNVNQHTRIQMMVYGGNVGKANVGVRFMNKRTYSILGLCTHYMGFDAQFSGALFYRFGLHHALSPRWRVSADGGFYHIETFEDASSVTPERLYSLQARFNVEYRMNPNLTWFASGGYGMRRYYTHGETVNRKPILELGVILF